MKFIGEVLKSEYLITHVLLLLDNLQSWRSLEKAVLAEVFTLTDDWRGQKSEIVFPANVRAAVEEAITPQGRICSCCGQRQVPSSQPSLPKMHAFFELSRLSRIDYY